MPRPQGPDPSPKVLKPIFKGLSAWPKSVRISPKSFSPRRLTFIQLTVSIPCRKSLTLQNLALASC